MFIFEQWEDSWGESRKNKRLRDLHRQKKYTRSSSWKMSITFQKKVNKWINLQVCLTFLAEGALHSGSIFIQLQPLRGSVSTSGRLLSSSRLPALTRCPDTAGGLWGTCQASSASYRFHPPLQTCKRPTGRSASGRIHPGSYSGLVPQQRCIWLK